MRIIEEVIKIGIAKYDLNATYKVEILKTNFKPGSGDYEDESGTRDDQFGEFYMIKYYFKDSKFSSGGGWYNSLSETISAAEQKTGGINWEY